MSAKHGVTTKRLVEPDVDAPLSDKEFERGYTAMLARRARAPMIFEATEEARTIEFRGYAYTRMRDSTSFTAATRPGMSATTSIP